MQRYFWNLVQPVLHHSAAVGEFFPKIATFRRCCILMVSAVSLPPQFLIPAKPVPDLTS